MTTTEAQSPAGDPHPGEIVYENNVENRVYSKRATEVPVAIAWVKLADTWVPVVKIVITGAGRWREMTSLGPDGQFLSRTTGTMGPPRQN
jgi:hypothetical protein